MQNTDGVSHGIFETIFIYRDNSNMAGEHFIFEDGLTNLYSVKYYDADPIT